MFYDGEIFGNWWIKSCAGQKACSIKSHSVFIMYGLYRTPTEEGGGQRTCKWKSMHIIAFPKRISRVLRSCLLCFLTLFLPLHFSFPVCSEGWNVFFCDIFVILLHYILCLWIIVIFFPFFLYHLCYNDIGRLPFN